MRRLFRELKRRNVYRVAVTYAVVAFVVWQAASLLLPALDFPAWTVDFVIVLTLLGFPVALVLAWAFEMTPEGVRRTTAVDEPSARTGPDEEGERAERRSGSRLALSALVGLGLVAAAVVGGWYLVGSGGETPAVGDGTVAVLPFEVTGSADSTWRSSMVSLLSTGLDGATGLRAISDRTVLATWETSTRAGAREGTTTEEAVAIARQVGARYAVVGTAAGLGPELQLSAAIHETTSGQRVGRIEVGGKADSVPALAGELTRRLLGALAAETGEGLRSADLASVTTDSDSALRAFLAGERHLRGDRQDEAVAAFEAAIREDSTFALPFARIAFLGLWHGDFEGRYMRTARELSGQLPERQRRLVRALHLGRIEHRTLAAADSLRRLTDEYPDDPSIWNILGEFVSHANIPRGILEVEAAHERAVELDPGNASYYDHYVLPAFTVHHDSALATSRLQDAPRRAQRRLYRLARDAVFGDSTRRRRALAAYDTVSVPQAQAWLVLSPLAGLQDTEVRHAVLRRGMKREDVEARDLEDDLFENLLRRGKIREALAVLRRIDREADGKACALALTTTMGLPVPDSMATRLLGPENLPADPTSDRLYCAGLHAAETGRSDELDALIRRLRTRLDTTGADDRPAAEAEATVRELRGFRAWKAGDLERAARLWSRSNEQGGIGAVWRGDLHRELGQVEKAEGWYLAAWGFPQAQEGLGRVYERMGRPEDAAAAYRRFIAAWEDADEELQPRVEAARERVRVLTGVEDAPDG